MSGPDNEHRANKIETGVKFYWAADTVIGVLGLMIQERALVAFFFKHSSLLEPIPEPSPEPLPDRNERTTSTWPTEFEPISRTWICSLTKH